MIGEVVNERTVNLVNEIVSTVVSLFVNTLLFYCIRIEKNKVLTGYKRMLITTCVIDYLSTFFMSISLMAFDFPSGKYVMIVQSPLRHGPLWVHYVLCTCYTFGVGLGTLNGPLNFYFRYKLVCKRTLMKLSEIVACCAFIFLYALFDSLCITYGFMENPHSMRDYEHLYENSTLWREADGAMSTFIVAENTATGLKMLLVFGGFVVCAEYTTILALRHFVMREFDRNRCTMTMKTPRSIPAPVLFLPLVLHMAANMALTCAACRDTGPYTRYRQHMFLQHRNIYPPTQINQLAAVAAPAAQAMPQQQLAQLQQLLQGEHDFIMAANAVAQQNQG
ncbi:hypothetical protein M3Y99_01517800 [Aphelenchoides fujianensis]|nr:hypothetical protein M3Y99_01517800 [Aphelenchoides fujianensis]